MEVLDNQKQNSYQTFSSEDRITSVTFDDDGYIIKVTGFTFLMWSKQENLDKNLIGKHIIELVKI